MTADLNIASVLVTFRGRPAASFVPGQRAPTVEPSFVNRGSASWIPNKLTLVLFNVTHAVEGEYRFEVISSGSSARTWIRKIHVSLRGKLSPLAKRNVISVAKNF